MLILLLCFSVLLIICLCLKPRNFPPGPAWLPIIGCELQIRKLAKQYGGRQHLILTELNKQYKTNVLGLKLGSQILVSVSSHDFIKKVFDSDAYFARPKNFFTKLRTIGSCPGITFSEGQFFKIQKKFLLNNVQNGNSKVKFEKKIKEELDDVLHLMSHKENVDFGKLVQPAVINVIWFLSSGNRINRFDPEFVKLFHLLDERSKAFDMAGGTLSNYPWLRFIAPQKVGYSLTQTINKQLNAFFMETITKHHEAWSNGNNEDLMYSFISRMQKGDETFTDDQLLMIAMDLFLGGSHSIAATLDYSCRLMLLYPDVQKKVHSILDENFPQNWSFQHSDRHKVPYIQAVLFEVVRFCPVFPIGGTRRALKATKMDGYTIPKGSTIVLNMYSLFTSKEIWGDPENFRPERFMNDKGLIIPPKFIPFGFGRRRCLGEAFARCFLFIFFSEIMKRYEVLPVESTLLPSILPQPGITSIPQPYTARFVRRDN